MKNVELINQSSQEQLDSIFELFKYWQKEYVKINEKLKKNNIIAKKYERKQKYKIEIELASSKKIIKEIMVESQYDEEKKLVIDMINKIIFNDEELESIIKDPIELQKNFLKFITTIVWSDINFHLNELTDITCDDYLCSEHITEILTNHYQEYILKMQSLVNTDL